MEYKEEIIRMLEIIDDDEILKKIYTFVKMWLRIKE